MFVNCEIYFMCYHIKHVYSECSVLILKLDHFSNILFSHSRYQLSTSLSGTAGWWWPVVSAMTATVTADSGYCQPACATATAWPHSYKMSHLATVTAAITLMKYSPLPASPHCLVTATERHCWWLVPLVLAHWYVWLSIYQLALAIVTVSVYDTWLSLSWWHGRWSKNNCI